MKVYLLIDINEMDMNECVFGVYTTRNLAEKERDEYEQDHTDFIILERNINEDL